jgi:hypothetical protein
MTKANSIPDPSSMAASGEVKGVQIRAVYMFLKERYGDEAVTAAMNALSPEDRLLMPTMLLDSNWYPHEIWRVIRRISRALDPYAGTDLTVSMGRYMAEYSFKGVYRSFLTPDPVKQVEKFRWIHDFFYKNVCGIEARPMGDCSAVVSYYYEKGMTVTGATCVLLMGFWTRTLELSGAKEVSASHPKCVSKGADRCEYSFNWQ